MAKGLPRSLSRGRKALQEVVRIDVAIDETITIAGGAADAGWGTAVISALPEGNIQLLGAVCNLTTITKGDADIIDAFNGDFALGSAPSTDETALTGTLDDLLPSTATVTGDTGVSTGNRGVATAAETIVLDNTAGTMEVNLNILIDDLSISDDASSVIVVGTLHMALIILGDD